MPGQQQGQPQVQGPRRSDGGRACPRLGRADQGAHATLPARSDVGGTRIAMTQSMKAWFAVPGPDGAGVELRERPVPVRGPGRVLGAVRAAGTNRGELIRGAALRSGAAAAPARAGTEFAGEITALGEGVSGWNAGDRVMGRSVG